MNGFSTVEKLKELEQKVPHFTHCEMHLLYPDGDEAGCFRSDFGNVTDDWMIADDLAGFFNDLRNAAPLLLDIAGQIQPEDKEILLWMRTGEGDLENDADLQDKITDLLGRYQQMAERMHEG